MSTPMLGEIRMAGFNFAPRGWALCDGQLLAISSNDALFSLLGTIYGGDGRTSFGLPDLRGRFPLHPGTGPGQPTYRLGQKGGNTSINQVPQHSHSVAVSAAGQNASTINPTGAMLAGPAQGTNIYAPKGGNAPVVMDPTSVQVGNASNSPGATVPVVNPYLGVNFIIALQGLFPSRS